MTRCRFVRVFSWTLVALTLVASPLWAAIDYAALKTELGTDPAGIGYAASVAAGNDTETARLINEVRTVAPTFTINRGPVSSQLVVNEFDATEFGLLVTNDLLRLSIVTQFGTVDLSDASTRQILGAIFPAGGPTRTNLIALATRACSRAEFLFGRGTEVSPVDVAKALR